MNLKSAVLLSLMIHLGFLGIRPPAGIVPPRETLNSIEVTYQSAEERVQRNRGRENAVVSRENPRKEPAKPPPSLASSREPVQPLKPTGEPKSLPRNQTRPSPSAQAPRPEVKIGAEEESQNSSVSVPKGMAAGLAESAFAAVEYKKLVRQQLKNRLAYPLIGIEGTVKVHLVVNPDGLLKQVEIMEYSDRRLAEAALDGIRSAAPYPRFPKEMQADSQDFDFLVQYCLGLDELDSL